MGDRFFRLINVRVTFHGKFRDQTIYTEKFRGIFSVGKHLNTVGCVGIIFPRPTLDKYRYFSAHFVVQKNMFCVIFYG